MTLGRFSARHPSPRAIPGIFPALFVAAATLLTHGRSSADASAVPTDFDRAAAAQALVEIDLSSCKRHHGGDGHILITFEPDGRASKAQVDQGVFVSSRTGRCIERRYRRASIPAFDGPPVRVGMRFHLD